MLTLSIISLNQANYGTFDSGKRIYLSIRMFDPYKLKVFGVKFSLGEIKRTFPIEIRDFEL